MVTAGSPTSYKKAVETLGVCFLREMGYDFRPFTASEYSNRIYRPVSERTTDVNTKSFLWYDSHEGHPGHWPTFGGCSFRLKGSTWMLMWIWMHPYVRRKGHLKAAWPFFRSMFGVFFPDPPVSHSLESFMQSIGYYGVMQKELERRKTEKVKVTQTRE